MASTLAAEQQAAYAAAQAIRTRGDQAQALHAFREFVRRYPASSLADDALLAVGQMATALGDYQQAQTAYTSLLTNFPTSEHRPTAHLELGILQYNTQDYTQSQETLRRYLTFPSPPARQALAHYYLGLMARQQHRYTAAIAALKLSVENSTDELLTEQARAEIEEIVRQHLSDRAICCSCNTPYAIRKRATWTRR
jgi:TolA-binding protein